MSLDELREFNQLGGEIASAAIAYKVYQDLQLDKRYSNVTKNYIEDLKIIYLIANRGGRKHIFIPSLVSQDCNLYELEKINLKLGELHEQSIMHLAICDTTSNVLYYTITLGFKDDPSMWKRKV